MLEQNEVKKTILILRFSSLGDVLQSLSVPAHIKESWINSEIHYVTRSEFVPLVCTHPCIDKVWQLNRQDGLKGLYQLCNQLDQVPWTHIYDAHNSLRSRLIRWHLIFWRALKGQRPQLTIKSSKRWLRFLLFKFRINKFKMPFSGQRDLLEPLIKFGLTSTKLPTPPQFFLKQEVINSAQSKIQKAWPPEKYKNFIALAPSAAHELKRWPIEYWQNLVSINKKNNFIALGGKEDLFIEKIKLVAPDRVLNFAGRLSIAESAAVISLSQGLVCNDTGLMHVAEQIGIKTIALMGPAPFGFPSRPTTTILERQLSCRPCSKHGQGPCINKEYQKCLRDISPEEVTQKMQNWQNS